MELLTPYQVEPWWQCRAPFLDENTALSHGPIEHEACMDCFDTRDRGFAPSENDSAAQFLEIPAEFHQGKIRQGTERG